MGAVAAEKVLGSDGFVAVRAGDRGDDAVVVLFERRQFRTSFDRGAERGQIFGEDAFGLVLGQTDEFERDVGR